MNFTVAEQVEQDKKYYTKRIYQIVTRARGYEAEGRTIRFAEAVKEAHRALGAMSALCGLTFQEYKELYNRIPVVK